MYGVHPGLITIAKRRMKLATASAQCTAFHTKLGKRHAKFPQCKLTGDFISKSANEQQQNWKAQISSLRREMDLFVSARIILDYTSWRSPNHIRSTKFMYLSIRVVKLSSFHLRGQLEVFSSWKQFLSPHRIGSTNNNGLHQFFWRSFDLKSDPATSQKSIEDKLPSVKCWSALVHLEESIVCSKTIYNHILYIRWVLTLRLATSTALRVKIASFCAETASYLGHVIQSVWLEINKITTKKFHELQDPTAQTELQAVLDLCGVFRGFVQNISKYTALLNWKLRKN